MHFKMLHVTWGESSQRKRLRWPVPSSSDSIPPSEVGNCGLPKSSLLSSKPISTGQAGCREKGVSKTGQNAANFFLSEITAESASLFIYLFFASSLFNSWDDVAGIQTQGG